jgi:hypothetical protein
LAQYFRQQRGAEETSDYNKLVIDQVQQIMQLNQQLMTKLSRLESDKIQFMENQNQAENIACEQIGEVAKKLAAAHCKFKCDIIFLTFLEQ